MKIPFFSHTREFEAHRTEFLEAIDQCLRSPTLILGKNVQTFEEKFSASCNCRYGVGVASGTDALALALRALDIGAGDEVLTVANTAVPTVAAVRIVGALPRFVDIDRQTFLMDLTKLEKTLTSKTKAIIPVHLFGNPIAMKDLMKFAQAHNLRVIEDCAQAYGATHEGKPVGSLGDISCFSFYPTKNLGAWGDGGMCVTNEESLAVRLKRLRSYGYGEPFYAVEEGINSRLDEVQAAILLVKLRYATKETERRRSIATHYTQAIERTALYHPTITKKGGHSYHLYVLSAPDRERTRKALERQGIATLVHYPHPIHLMPAYQFLGYERGSLPVTEEVMQHIFSLPLFPLLEDREVDYVVNALHAIH